MSAEVIKKLRMQSGQHILIINPPEGYLDSLAPLPENIELSFEPEGKYDHVHLFVSSIAELESLGPQAVAAVKPDALFWISYPKKSSKIKTDLHRDAGWEIMTDAGYEGVALIAIDETWSAMRFRPIGLASTMSASRERLSTNQKMTIDPSRSVEVPEDFQAFLNGKPAAKAFFDGLAYTNRKEYVRWITDAKRAETRKSRLEKAMVKLEQGIKGPHLKE